MKNKSVITVVIPCYNSEKYLDDCLSNLLNQTYEYIEVIIVNDGSTDNSEQIINNYIKKFNKTNKKLILINQENQGQAVACNNAIKRITGDYIVWQDSDDYYDKDAFENMYNFLKNNKQYDLVIGAVRYIYEDGSSKEFLTNINQKKNVFKSYLFDKGVKCYPGLIMTSTSFFDSRIINRDIYAARCAQNWQLILPLTYKSKIGFLNKIVYNYRIVSNSMSHKKRSYYDLKKRFYGQKKLAINTIKRISNMSNIRKIYYILIMEIKFVIKNIKLFVKEKIIIKIRKDIIKCQN